MKRNGLVPFCTLTSLMLAALVLPTSLRAQGTFVYTNNDFGPGFGFGNSVSALSVGPAGALTPVAGSPFATGANSWGGGIGNTNRIAITTIPGNFLYATNAGGLVDVSNSISGFSIDTITGALTLLPGSPFATGVEGLSLAASVAVTPDGQFLYAAFSASNNISAFRIASNGTLMPIPGSPFSDGVQPTNMKVTPDGRFLAVAEGCQSVSTCSQGSVVAMFSIGSNGALTPVPGSPFVSGGFPPGLDVNCASNLLFAPTGTLGQGGVNVVNIASNGALTPIAGSPFTFSGSFSFADVLSPDDKHLFVSNAYSGTITSLNVASGGSLTEVSGSPFPTSPFGPYTVATNQAGTLLYGALGGNGNNIIALNIDSNGALSPVAGSPFSNGALTGSILELAVFPPKSCSPVPSIISVSPTSAIAGGAAFTLTVNGTNFVSGSTVNFNGSDVATTFVSSTQLVAAIPASDITTADTFNVTVTNPGGTTSNAVNFTVLTPEQATQAIINSVNALFSQGVLNGGQDNSLVRQLQQAINLMNAGKNAGAIGNLDSFISEVNDLLSSGVLSPSQAASLISAAQSVIAALP